MRRSLDPENYPDFVYYDPWAEHIVTLCSEVKCLLGCGHGSTGGVSGASTYGILIYGPTEQLITSN